VPDLLDTPDFSTPFPDSRRLPEVMIVARPGRCLKIVRFTYRAAAAAWFIGRAKLLQEAFSRR